MDGLIPIGNALEENLWVKKLEQQGYIIKPEKINKYLNDFKTIKSALPNKNYWSEKCILITGISGFAGSHFAEELLDLGCKVHGTIRRHAITKHENIEHLRGRIILHEADTTI